MKKQFYTLAVLLAIGFTANAQVGIGTTTPEASSLLELKSITKGFLMPRLTATQMTGLDTPALGLQIYNTTTNTFWYYNGSTWINGNPAQTNIYNVDGTLTGNRNVNLDSKTLTFYNGSSSMMFNNTATRSNLRGTAAGNAYLDLYVDSAGPAMLMAGGTAISLNIGSSTGDNTPLRFVTNGVNRGVVLGTGNMGVGTDFPTSKLEVNGAVTNSVAYNAGSGTTIDYSLSNLAYTTANAQAFTLTNVKDGGTYSLSVRGIVSGTSTFTATGFTIKYANNRATTASKDTMYTFVAMGSILYVYTVAGL